MLGRIMVFVLLLLVILLALAVFDGKDTIPFWDSPLTASGGPNGGSF
jgi:hypothetical protein